MKNKPTAKKSALTTIIKRDGSVVPFDSDKIARAVEKAMYVAGEFQNGAPEKIAEAISKKLLARKERTPIFVPTVEGVQDLVEAELMLQKFPASAKSYILYRQKRAELRVKGVTVPEKVQGLAAESKKYFKNALGEFVYYRTYSRWIPEENRRETWVETVERYLDFMKENLGGKLKESEYKEVKEAILKQEAMPSMRLLQFAGKAARATNVAAYNCSYIAPKSFQDFAEIMYISMCGTGVGWSAESENIEKLPQIQKQTGKKPAVHVVADSKEGWADALSLGMKTWAQGRGINFDFSKLRPAGTRLNTMGGKASGPQPLMDALSFTKLKMLARQGKRLRPIDAHDIICKIGECVVAGGVRRSAMISLSDLEDEQIRDAKKGQFWSTDPQRMLANNSAVYNEKPTNEQFMDEWIALMKSGAGERGIFNRGGLAKTMPEKRLKVWRDMGVTSKDGRFLKPVGTNPCGEIILQSKQFCNLSEVVARHEDTLESLKRKIKVATILGTYQASLIKFPYLSKAWKDNCEREALLGVSITGQWDSPVVRKPEVLKELKAEAIKVNKEYAKRFGINESTCITCVKPSGNLSQTVDCSSGVHPRYSAFYIRRVRIAATDSLFKMLKDQGVPYHPEVGQRGESATTFVIDFPVKAPDSPVFKDDQTAIEQLEYWKTVKENFTEHNPSTTVSIGEDEWVEVASWLYKNWDIIGGLAFLPKDNHVYQLAPYEEISEKKYQELLRRVGHIDFAKIVTYEGADETEQRQELACVSGVCDIDAIGTPLEINASTG